VAPGRPRPPHPATSCGQIWTLDQAITLLETIPRVDRRGAERRVAEMRLDDVQERRWHVPLPRSCFSLSCTASVSSHTEVVPIHVIENLKGEGVRVRSAYKRRRVLCETA
jgi:hypothetical protein